MIRSSQRSWFVLAWVALACGGATDSDDGAGGGSGGASCVHAGTTYQVGDSFQIDCNTCQCTEHGIACTEMACTPGGCFYAGQTYVPGQSFPASDGCNTCSCDVGGTISCTLVECAPATCTYAGKPYAAGASFPSLDGCNTCVCASDGSVSCTELACPCDPAAEWWRHYASKSAQECKTIKYPCPDHTTGFSNACGCGCEQDASCPQWFDCMPPAPCDADLLKMCPYSGVES